MINEVTIKNNFTLWKKFVYFFKYEKGYYDWTDDEIYDTLNNDDIKEFTKWIDKRELNKD